MKQLLLIFFYLLIALSVKGQYQAQVTDEGMDFPDYVDHVFEYMDLSQVPSGLLAERALRLIPLELYDGQTINDTTQLNFNIFNQVYYMAYAAAVSSSIFPLAPPLKKTTQ